MTDEPRAARRHRYARMVRLASSLETAETLLEAYACGERATGAKLFAEVRELRSSTYADLLRWALARSPAPGSGENKMHASELLALRRHAMIGWLAMAAEAAWDSDCPMQAAAIWRATQTAAREVAGNAAMLTAFERPEHVHAEKAKRQS